MIKHLFTTSVLFLFIVWIPNHTIHGQCDYINMNYSVTSELNVPYGSAEMFNGRMIDLKMNIFKPQGDDNLKRPLFIWVHGGGFSTGGADDMNTLCQIMASKGIVAATISYRLGFATPEGMNYPSTYDSSEVVRAVYRGMQDAKGAIRFLKSRHSVDSTDINQVFLGGMSAGGFVALAASYMDKEADKPSSTEAIGDINQGGQTIKRPDLGNIEGDLHVGQYDAFVKGVVNLYGGIIDLNLIDPEEKKYAYLYHQTLDPVVPCHYNQPYWVHPEFRKRYPFVYGSCEILKRYDELGIGAERVTSIIHEGTDHNIHDLLVFTQTLNTFLDDAICDSTTATTNLHIERGLVYPNPSMDFIHVQRLENMTMVDVNGRLQTFSATISGDQMKIDISALSPGMYFISGQQQNGHMHRCSFIKVSH